MDKNYEVAKNAELSDNDSRLSLCKNMHQNMSILPNDLKNSVFCNFDFLKNFLMFSTKNKVFTTFFDFLDNGYLLLAMQYEMVFEFWYVLKHGEYFQPSRVC